MLDAIKLLRIPFSVFLMPVFWLTLFNLNTFSFLQAVHVFVIIHFFVYPASNGYNSFHDKDRGSIGGLEKPPAVNRFLFPFVLVFESIALIYSFLIFDFIFVSMILCYLLVSKAYSYKKIRLKKYPISSTFIVVVFQGFFIYMAIAYALSENPAFLIKWRTLSLGLCSSVLLLGSYPLTQVYQHEEDRSRGDYTLSLLLGVKGTFLFSGAAFFLGATWLFFWFIEHRTVDDFLIFAFVSIPILFYFAYWFYKVKENTENANYRRAMNMNIISSICLSGAFIYLLMR